MNTDTRRLRQRLAERARRREEMIKGEIERLTQALIQMGAERIILFGSRARGEARRWSDADMLAVLPSDLPFVERMAEIYRQLVPCGVDLLIYTPEEFTSGSLFIRRALQEGKVLYGKEVQPA